MSSNGEGLRCVFVVQGEGRGHMTQALATEEILRGAGHRVTTVFLGRSEHRPVPGFFRRRTAAEVETFPSPVLVPDRGERGMSASATALHNLLRLPRYLRSVVVLGRRLREEEPDVVINFFDVLGAVAALTHRPARRHLAVGHHFLTAHPDFPRPSESTWGWWGLRLLTRLCGLGASRRLALSYRPLDPPDGRTAVVPPLLRRAVLDARPEDGEHLQVYLLNPGYRTEVEAWHARNRDVPVEVFWDRQGAPRTLRVHENLRFHRIDDRKFVEGMRRCRALATTAGFESIAEAMFLGKPVLAVPTEGHVEQACNALDAERAGAGLRRDRFALDDLLRHLDADRPVDREQRRRAFRGWVRSAPERVLREVEGRSAPSRRFRSDESPSRRSREEVR